LFNNYIQKKQEAETLLKRQQSVRRNILMVSLVALAILALVLVLLVTRKRHKQAEANLREAHQRQREAFDQQREAFSQQLTEAQAALKEKTFEDLVKETKALYDKGGRPRKGILEAFNKAYPDVYEKLKSTYPDLTEQERDLLVLNFLRFRIKEEAEILELSQNTVTKYRSDLIKKVGKNPVSDLWG
jgi:type II secretory pathway pseudopilin PulG